MRRQSGQAVIASVSEAIQMPKGGGGGTGSPRRAPRDDDIGEALEALVLAPSRHTFSSLRKPCAARAEARAGRAPPSARLAMRIDIAPQDSVDSRLIAAPLGFEPAQNVARRVSDRPVSRPACGFRRAPIPHRSSARTRCRLRRCFRSRPRSKRRGARRSVSSRRGLTGFRRHCAGRVSPSTSTVRTTSGRFIAPLKRICRSRANGYPDGHSRHAGLDSAYAGMTTDETPALQRATHSHRSAPPLLRRAHALWLRP